MMNDIPRIIVLGLCLLLASSAPLATTSAHHSPEDIITDLTTQIESRGGSAKLYVRRADEWRILGEPTKAAADYQLALKHDPKNRLAYYGLARTQIGQKRYDAAIKSAQRGIELVRDRDSQAAFHALVAIAYSNQDNHRSALDAWAKAIDCEKSDVDWLLEHARTLQSLGRHLDARNALFAARKSNPSVVLKRAWIRSLIRCGDYQAAEKQITAGLERSRWKSSWMVLQADLYCAKGDPTRARQFVLAAIQEIDIQIVPNVKNPLLERQQEQAKLLLKKISNSNQPRIIQSLQTFDQVRK